MNVYACVKVFVVLASNVKRDPSMFNIRTWNISIICHTFFLFNIHPENYVHFYVHTNIQMCTNERYYIFHTLWLAFFMRLFCSFTSDFPTPAISTYSTHEKQKGRERRTRREEKWIWWRTYTHNNDISRPVVILDRGVTRSRPPCGQLRKRSQSSSLVIL